MSIKAIELMSFRNHNCAEFIFSQGVNIIWGENGSGKTSIIEAVHLLSIGRSFRTHKRKDLLQEGKKNFQVKGVFEKDKKHDKIQVNQLEDGKRKTFINNVSIDGLKELVGRHPVVLLSPEEQNITKGSPKDRRQYFDKLFSVVSSEYMETLIQFNNVLKQRNASLQACKENRTSLLEVEAWEEPLAKASVELWELRKNLFDELCEHYKKAVNNYKENTTLTVNYKQKDEVVFETFLEQLKDRRNKDIISTTTSVGPHKDEYSYTFNGKDLRPFASQGEHKLALILIKLAELYFIKEQKGDSPVFLLDDLLAKLDKTRAGKVISLLTKSAQTIITTTDLTYINKWNTEWSEEEINSIHLEKPCKA